MQTSPSALLSRPAAAPCFVVSPHLDDAVFSCGRFLASRPGAVVCTVFCGAPEPPMQTPWDTSAGHRDWSEAMSARIAEDERALGDHHPRRGAECLRTVTPHRLPDVRGDTSFYLCTDTGLPWLHAPLLLSSANGQSDRQRRCARECASFAPHETQWPFPSFVRGLIGVRGMLVAAQRACVRS